MNVLAELTIAILMQIAPIQLVLSRVTAATVSLEMAHFAKVGKNKFSASF
jgi:hypothetical protein